MLVRKPTPPTDYLRECFRYEPDTGGLSWMHRPKSHFLTVKGHLVFSSRFAGKEAFTATDSGGYRQGKLDGITYRAHQIIWKLVTGKDAAVDLDHKDGDVLNNCWGNIREATRAQNIVNRKAAKGAYFDLRSKKWKVIISFENRIVYRGSFSTSEEALDVRRRKLVEYYGDFAP